MGGIAVHAAPLPFSQWQVHSQVPSGTTLAQIVADILPERFIGKVDVIAQINGHTIFPKYWHHLRPKDGTIVNIRAIPLGGGDGKNPLATVLSIAVMIAAPYAAGALATNVGLGIFGGGVLTSGQLALTKGLLTAGFSVLGRLAVSAIAPPPKPTNVGVVNNPAESPTQFIEGATNQLNPYGVIPVCLGTNRMVPPMAAKPYTETQDNNNYVRQLFTWGYGEQISVTDIKIGETSINQFEEVETDSRLQGNLHLGTDLFSNTVIQDTMSILLEEPDGFTQRTVATNSSETIIDVTWPQGLGYINDLGNRGSLTVQLEIQYRETDSVGAWTTALSPYVTASQNEALVKSFRILFPAAGDYDVRIRRITPDFEGSATFFDKTYLSAIRGVRYGSPVDIEGINGTAIRIRATDQLNGSIDQLNALVSNLIPDYDTDSGNWIARATSNPAAIYRYVLQGYPNARKLSDDRIRLEDLEAWHDYCRARGYTYNRVIDYDTSVEEILADVASAGAASPAIVDGKRTIVVDREKDDIVQIITPRNSWQYQGEMVYPQLPHAFRVTFRNAAAGYQVDERIVYADGYDAETATLFETLDLPSCTDSDLAYKTARRLMATVILRPETHTFSMDVEHLVAIRGDRIKFEHDIPLVGVGDARIKTVTTEPFKNNVMDGANNVVDGLNEVVDSTGAPLVVTAVSLDDTISIPTAGTYYMRIRLSDGTQIYKQVVASVGQATSFEFSEPFTIDDTPAPGDLCYVVEAGGELDLIITRIEPGPDLTAKITCLDYAPGIFAAETGIIPSFESRITTPIEFIRPLPPVLLQDPQVDETVLQRNPDGTFLSRAVISLRNDNDGQVTPEVRIRPTGSTLFAPANLLESSPSRVVITGLTPGTRYDVFIRYRRANSSVYSLPLQLNSMLYVGYTGLPSDVTGFKVSVTDATALFSWDKSEDIDFAYSRMKFSSRTTGVTWATAQLLVDRIYDNRLTLTFQPGTYLLKHVDLQGNESENATVLTVVGSVNANAVEYLQEDPTFAGTKIDVEVVGSSLRLSDPTIPEGIYYFDNRADLDAIYTAFVSAAIVAGGVVIDDSSSLANDIFAMTDVFAVSDVFGLSEGSWSILLEFRLTTDDPDDSGAVWTDWAEFVASSYIFRGMEFRLQLNSLEPGISPQISELAVTIDMPDRIERGEDLTVPDTGITITYEPPFKSAPAVVVTVQDGDEGDEIQFTAKDAGGFTFRVYNKNDLAYVERTFDYVASGYGRETV